MKSPYEMVNPNPSPQAGARPKGSRPTAGQLRKRLGQAVVACLVVLVALVVWSGWRLRAEQAYNLHNLIRLHVVANSDKPADQEVKLEVRDAILGASENILSTEAPDDAMQAIEANLPLFRRVAENVLAANGYDYRVDAEVGTFAFPERVYGPLVLPAGDYRALRIVLGAGKGANWWCILFPPLCYLDVVGGDRQAQWGVAPNGTLTPAAAGSGPATRVVSADSLTAEQALDLQGILEKALANMKAGSVAPAADAGVKVIVSGIPASPDSDLVILVADTGSSRTEVRFYVFDRLRDLIRSLAVSAPWLVQSLPNPGSQVTPPER